MLRGMFAKAGDAQFIAHARTSVPQLVALLREAVALVQEGLDGMGAGGWRRWDERAEALLEREVGE
jgi:hypothetical protein